jgi:hypothetical protein
MADAQAPCPQAELRAYAHNDYENARPLADALRLGYRGVEADVFLVDHALRVGHDRRRARRGGTLEALYLEPLGALAAQCGGLTADGRPFLLAVELKEPSPPTYAALVQLLARYSRLLTPAPDAGGAAAPVEVVLVGWHPPLSALRADSTGLLVRLQQRLTRPEDAAVAPGSWVRLLSLDYGKTIGRRWATAASRRRWLAALREAKRAAPGRLLRVHNVPEDSRAYAALLDAGVDLIGSKQLATTRRLLLARGTP